MSDVAPGRIPATGQVTSNNTKVQLITPQSGASAGVGRCAKYVLVRALSTNSAPVFLGGTNAVDASTGLCLAPTDPPIKFALDDASRLWVFSAASQVTTWMMV
jgi:hypothetical protein